MIFSVSSVIIATFFLLLFTGASAGSTSGGMKIVRIVILIKNGVLEFKRRIHPNAVVPVHLNGKSIANKVIYNLLAFVFLYLFMFLTFFTLFLIEQFTANVNDSKS